MTGPRTRKAKTRLYPATVMLSVAAHVGVILAVWAHAPKLERPREEAGPPEPIIPVLILPRAPPAANGSTEKPQPIRLHRRRLHPQLEPPPEIPPFIVPQEETEGPPKPRGPVAPRVTVLPTPAGQLSAVLRASPVGCANTSLLSRAEREACLARLGRGAVAAPYLPPALDRTKQERLDAAGAERERNIRLKEGPIPAGPALPGMDSGASNRNKPLYTPSRPPLRP